MKQQAWLLLIVILGAAAGCRSPRLASPSRSVAILDEAKRDPVLIPDLQPESHNSTPSALGGRTAADVFIQPAGTTSLPKTDADAGKAIKPASFIESSNPTIATTSPRQSTARIRAMVGNVPILEEELQEALLPLLPSLRNKSPDEQKRAYNELETQVLNQLIDREVVVQDAYRRLNQGGQKQLEKLKEAAERGLDRQLQRMKTQANIKTDEELEKILRLQGMTLENLKRRHERDYIFSEYLSFRIKPMIDHEVSHQHIVEYFHAHPEEFQVPDSVHWQDIFLDVSLYPDAQAARAFAEQLAARAKAGDDFLKLAAKYDTGPSKLLGGDGQGRLRGEIRPMEIENTLFKMRDGDIGIFQLPTGDVHVFRLVKRQKAGVMPLDEKLQAQIRDKLKGLVYQREARRIIEELRRATPIEIFKKPE